MFSGAGPIRLFLRTPSSEFLPICRRLENDRLCLPWRPPRVSVDFKCFAGPAESALGLETYHRQSTSYIPRFSARTSVRRITRIPVHSFLRPHPRLCALFRSMSIVILPCFPLCPCIRFCVGFKLKQISCVQRSPF
jgi:hypothetical protein